MDIMMKTSTTKSTTTNNLGTCLPSKETRTYVTIGQDLFSIEDYVREQYNYSLHVYMKNHNETTNTTTTIKNTTTTTVMSTPKANNKEDDDDDVHLIIKDNVPTLQSVTPKIYMFYTDIQTLRGLTSPVDYGSGTEYANGILDYYSNGGVYMNEYKSSSSSGGGGGGGIGIQIGFWLNGTSGCQNIVNGLYDTKLDTFFYYLFHQTYRLQKIFLRIGYEFDNPQFNYLPDPNLYQQAYRYIVNYCRTRTKLTTTTSSSSYFLYNSHKQRIRQHCNERIDFVWHSWAAGGLEIYNKSISDFYPGDDYVDWIGISVFNQFNVFESQAKKQQKQQQKDMYNKNNKKKHRQHKKSKRIIPPTITEVCDYAIQHSKPIMIAESSPFGGMEHYCDVWDDWFVPVLSLMKYYHIQMWSYINCNWNEQSMWSNTPFGNSRIAYNSTIQELWYQKILQNTKQFESNMNDQRGLCTGNSIGSTTSKAADKLKRKNFVTITDPNANVNAANIETSTTTATDHNNNDNTSRTTSTVLQTKRHRKKKKKHSKHDHHSYHRKTHEKEEEEIYDDETDSLLGQQQHQQVGIIGTSSIVDSTTLATGSLLNRIMHHPIPFLEDQSNSRTCTIGGGASSSSSTSNFVGSSFGQIHFHHPHSNPFHNNNKHVNTSNATATITSNTQTTKNNDSSQQRSIAVVGIPTHSMSPTFLTTLYLFFGLGGFIWIFLYQKRQRYYRNHNNHRGHASNNHNHHDCGTNNANNNHNNNNHSNGHPGPYSMNTSPTATSTDTAVTTNTTTPSPTTTTTTTPLKQRTITETTPLLLS